MFYNNIRPGFLSALPVVFHVIMSEQKIRMLLSYAFLSDMMEDNEVIAITINVTANTPTRI